MEHLVQILARLKEGGFTEHVYRNNEQWHCNGSVLHNTISIISCFWFDELTDQRITVYCVSNRDIKGVAVTMD